MKYDYTVFIGRFQPIHLDHIQACKQALTHGKHLLILVGSAFAAPNIRNPFTFEQRRDMIGLALRAEDISNFTILPLRDHYYSDNAWISQVQQIVSSVVGNASVSLLGYKKDSSSYYLDFFPQWNPILIASDMKINATDIRYKFLETEPTIGRHREQHEILSEGANGLLPIELENIHETTQDFLQKIDKVEQTLNLRNEFTAMKAYQKAWENAPYTPTFVTTDAVVICCGHVLLVTRRAYPGKGLYALPGGFLNQEERIEDGCLRELKEETRIKVPLPVLKGSIQESRVFDHPLRSVRGRTITHAYYIPLEESKLPKVKGADDAEKAFWLPLSEVEEYPEKFFEDHQQIIESFIGRGNK